MKIKIKKSSLLDYTILYWIIIYVFVINWLAYIRQGTAIMIILILIRFLVDFRHVIHFAPLYLGLLFSIGYPFVNYWIIGGNFDCLIQNSRVIFATTLLLTYATFLCKYKSGFIYDFFVKNKILFNGYMLLNIPVLLLQLSGNTSLSGRHPEELTNVFSADLTSGLFGYNGTGSLTIFFCFLILYNYFLYKFGHVKQKTTFIIYNIVLIFFISFVAVNSDNKALFILLPVLLAVYLIIFRINLNKNILKKIKILFKYLFSALLIFTILIVILQPFMGTFDLIHNVFDKTRVGWEMMNRSYGSAERFGMIAYALSISTIRWTGAGIGRYNWQESYALNFVHFGISDFGSFLCLGGISFIVIIILYLWNIYRKLFQDNLSSLTFLIATLIVLIYTQLFTVLSLMCSWVFVIFVTLIGCEYKKVNK